MRAGTVKVDLCGLCGDSVGRTVGVRPGRAAGPFSRARRGIGSSELSDSQIACKTLRDEERILRSFFIDSYPVVIFLGLFYVLSWFRKK